MGLLCQLTLGICLSMAAHGCADGSRIVERRDMLGEIESMAGEVILEGEGSGIGQSVLTAMGRVPRHAFVPAEQVDHAYENRPLPIGYGQTISQPYIVALMTQLANVDGPAVVLEVGTGSGYQAAVLGQLAARVYSLEIVEPLAELARGRLAELGYDNVITRHGDGYHGWPEHGPYDAILVTAAASHVPPPLVKQLKPGGRLVIPVGSRFLVQYLMLVEKDARGEVTTRQILPVRFVPLTGEH